MKNLSPIFFALLISNSLRSQTLTFTVLNLTGSNSITCSTPSVSFYAYAAATGSVTYLWNGPVALLGNSVNIGTPGVYTVTAVSGSLTSTQFFSIGTNTTAPVGAVTPTFQNITCSLTSVTPVTVTAISPTANVTHMIMNPQGGTVSINSYSGTFPPQAPGTYSYVIVDNVNGCISLTKTFTVFSTSSFPTFSVVSPQNFTLGCGTKSVVNMNIINASTSPTPGGPVTYTMLPPQTGSNTAPGILATQSSYTGNIPGNYTFVTKDNTNLCESRVQVSVLANTAPPSLFAAVPFQMITCNMSSVSLLGLSGTTNMAFTWMFPGTPGTGPNPLTVVGNSASPTTTLLANYTLVVTDQNSTCKSTSVIPIYQDILKPAVSAPVFNVLCPTPTANIYPNPLPDPQVYSYQWTAPPNATVTGNQTGTLNVNAVGIYSLTITNTVSGCVGTGTVGTDQCVGIAENNVAAEISVFPNPVKNLLHFKIPGTEKEFVCHVFNAIGQEVLSTAVNATHSSIDFGALPSGVYLIKMEGIFFKVVKE